MRLERGGDERDVDLRIARIDEECYRIEAERKGETNPAYPAIRSTRWVAIVRRDLDWCVERFEIAASYGNLAESSDEPVDIDPFADLRSDPFETLTGDELFASHASGETSSRTARIVERSRVIRRRNELRRIDGNVVATESHWMGADWPKDRELTWHFVSERLTVDPPIDERIFSRPTLDSPDPAVPQERSWLTWYAGALLLGFAILFIDPLRAAAKRLSRKGSQERRRAGDAAGKDSA